jgi:hypothetical protein
MTTQPGNLKDYHVTPNRRGGVENIPAEEFRLHDDEIKCAQEYEAQAASKKPAKKEETKKPISSPIQTSSTTHSSASSDGEPGEFDFLAPERKDVKVQKSRESD